MRWQRTRTMMASPEQRPGETYDLIVIGAGINGAGIARDAALRGLRVLILDKGDLCAGASGGSTRLIHGGLRYLEFAEIGLVRESLREREALLQLAPHLVKPILLMAPIYKGAYHGPWSIRAGMVAYDVLSYGKSVDHHHMLSRDQALQRMPGLNPDGLVAAALYYDAQIEYSERLIVENTLSARQHGTTVRTYCRVDRFLLDGNRVKGVAYTDLMDNQTHTAQAHYTVNVAGPWVDQVLRGLGRPVPRLIGGTKGSHLVVDPFPGAPADGVYVEARTDRRPYFILPWNDRYLIGTTDIRFQGDLDHLEAQDAEIEYLLRETNRVIPGAGLTRDSVLYTYSGIRPLPYVAQGAAGAITRRHILHDHAPEILGLMSIIGGKLTTYRNLAEQAVDTIFAKLGRTAPPCTTRQAVMPGATAGLSQFRESFTQESGLSARTVNHLLRVYGTRAKDVLALANDAPDLREVFDPDTGAIGAEVVMAVRQEMARTLGDILLRRTMVGLGGGVGLNADKAAAEIARRHLGWDQARIDQEIDAYRKYVQRFHPRTPPPVPPAPSLAVFGRPKIDH